MANHKQVLRLMREETLLVQVKRYVRTTFSQHGLGRYPNLIKDLEPEGPDHIWCADITYIRLRGWFIFLGSYGNTFRAP